MKKIRATLALGIFMAVGTTGMMTSCKTTSAGTTQGKVVNTELIRTSQSWDGVELPDYLQGKPELVAVKYVFPAGQKLGWHHHPVMNYGVLVEGELTIIGQDGKEKVVTTARTAARSQWYCICSIWHRKVCLWPCNILRYL